MPCIKDLLTSPDSTLEFVQANKMRRPDKVYNYATFDDYLMQISKLASQINRLTNNKVTKFFEIDLDPKIFDKSGTLNSDGYFVGMRKAQPNEFQPMTWEIAINSRNNLRILNAPKSGSEDNLAGIFNDSINSMCSVRGIAHFVLSEKVMYDNRMNLFLQPVALERYSTALFLGDKELTTFDDLSGPTLNYRGGNKVSWEFGANYHTTYPANLDILIPPIDTISYLNSVLSKV